MLIAKRPKHRRTTISLVGHDGTGALLVKCCAGQPIDARGHRAAAPARNWATTPVKSRPVRKLLEVPSLKPVPVFRPRSLVVALLAAISVTSPGCSSASHDPGPDNRAGRSAAGAISFSGTASDPGGTSAGGEAHATGGVAGSNLGGTGGATGGNPSAGLLEPAAGKGGAGEARGGSSSGGAAASGAGGSAGGVTSCGTGAKLSGLPKRAQILAALRLSNTYFVSKWPDPTLRIDASHPSNL